MGSRSSWWLPLSVAVLVAAACSGPTGHPAPTGPAWQAVTLPLTGSGRPEIEDVATCPGHWYAVGAYLAAGGETAPAAWTSADAGRTWTALATRPVSAYGPQHVLTAVACRDDAVVAVGGAPGGAHGNLRTGTWLSTGGGPLTEIPAGLDLFGGDAQIGVGRLAAGPPGWVLAGDRRAANGAPGAVVWTAPDGRSFRLVDADPALSSDARGQTEAQDVLSTGDGFTLVGGVIVAGRKDAARDPAVWTSADGLRWTRVDVPAAPEDEELERVIGYGDGLLALGVRGAGFGAWRESAGAWRAVSRFGGFAGTSAARVTGLAGAPGGRVYATLVDGSAYQLWESADGTAWTRLAMPATVPAGAGHTVTLHGDGTHLLLAADATLYLAAG